MKLLIKDLMTRGIVSATADTPLLDVIRTMRDQRLSCMVVTEKDLPVGIITERDIVHTLAGVLESDRIDPGLRAGSIMSTPPITLPETATLFEALVITRTHHIRHVPVISGAGEYIGMITQSNMAQAHFDVIEQQTEALEKSVLQRTAELTEANQELLELSLTDGLLGIGNRRAMEVDLEHTFSAARRYHRPCSLALLDVDYFKRYNDRYGHQAGDDALKEITDVISAGIRNHDRLYRYGGEELLLLLPDTPAEEAAVVVQRLIDALSRKHIPHEDSPLGYLTISAGLAGMPPGDGEYGNHLIAAADRALYDAKDSGRNRMVCASTTEKPPCPEF